MSDYIIEKQWITKEGLNAVVVRLENIYMSNNNSHRCGYVGVNEQHPLFGKGYSEHLPCLIKQLKKAMEGTIGKRGVIPLFCYDGKKASMEIVFDVHGSITYSGTQKDYPIKTDEPIHWMGFDCAHTDDTIEKCTLNFCIKECENLAEQIYSIEMD